MTYQTKAQRDAYSATRIAECLAGTCGRLEGMCFDCWLNDMHRGWERDAFRAKCVEAARAPAGTSW